MNHSFCICHGNALPEGSFLCGDTASNFVYVRQIQPFPVPGDTGCFTFPDAFTETGRRNILTQCVCRSLKIVGQLLIRSQRQGLWARVEIWTENTAIFRDPPDGDRRIPFRSLQAAVPPVLVEKCGSLLYVLRVREIQPPCIGKEHGVPTGIFIYDPCTAGNPCSVEESCRKSKDRFHPSVAENPPPDFLLRMGLSRQCPVGKKYGGPAGGREMAENVLKPCEIGIFARRESILPMNILGCGAAFVPVGQTNAEKV